MNGTVSQITLPSLSDSRELASAATAALRERSKVAAVERRTSARAAALARRRVRGGSGSDSGTPEQLRWSESEVAELSVSLVFNTEDWSRDTEPETCSVTEERAEERTEERAEEGAEPEPSLRPPPTPPPMSKYFPEEWYKVICTECWVRSHALQYPGTITVKLVIIVMVDKAIKL
jgi:hypothetical protein